MSRSAGHRGLAALLVVAMTAPVSIVSAEPRKMQILKSEGRVDNNIKTRVDAAIIKLARTNDVVISPGDITMSDAAAAVGCKIEAPGCKDEILGMLAVDEVVYSTVVAKPGATDVIAFRVSKGGVTREARSTILAGNSPDKIDGIATLFMAAGSLPPPPEPEVTTPPPIVPPPGIETTTTTVETTRIVEPASPVMPARPNDDYRSVDATGPQPSKLPMIGMIGGGVVVLLSFASWAKASDVQGQIDGAPSGTPDEIEHIRDLEREGDDAASAGNVLFVVGAIVGGISTYAFIRQRRAQSRWQNVGATTLPNYGIGITWGGSL